MGDDEPNPYAPPAEPVLERETGGDGARRSGASDYSSERRPVVLAILLTLVTGGIYPAVWVYRRRSFLDSLDASKRMGKTLPSFLLVASVVSLLVAFGGKETASLQALVSTGGTVAAIVANFRVADILRSNATRTGRFVQISSLATFFLGVYYLQYKINRLAEIPAHVAKQTKKRKPRTADLETGEP